MMKTQTTNTQVAIIGAGPSGLLLSLLLDKAGISSIVLERMSGDYVLKRIRAGVLEQGFAKLVRAVGAHQRMESEGLVHRGVEFSLNDERFPIALTELSGESIIAYGQTDITADMMRLRTERGLETHYEVQQVSLHAIASGRPSVTYTKAGREYKIDCDFIAGCDGFHGVSRNAIPDDIKTEYEKVYPFAWLGLLSDTPPVNSELIYARSDRGFALASMRSLTRSRYYLQVPASDSVEQWSDDAFWAELKKRLPQSAADVLLTGASIEKSIVPLRSFICEPLQYGRLFLVGDAGHIVPPTGAKGLNLAASDVATLYQVLDKFYQTDDETVIERYSSIALRRVWNGARFSWWMTDLLHDFGTSQDAFDKKLKYSELRYVLQSEAGKRLIAEQYVGLPYETVA